MNAPTGLSNPISQLMPAVMILVTTKSFACSRIISLMSPSFSSSICHSPATPALERIWKISTPFSIAAIAFSPTCLTIRLRMLRHVSPNSEASSLMMPSRSNLSGSSTPPSANSPNSQPIRPLRRWSRMLSLNLRMPPFTLSIRLPRKRTGALMMSPTTPATRASTFISIDASWRIVLMIGLDCADGLVDQALVFGLQLLDPLVEALAGFDVLRGQGVDDGFLLGVDVVFKLLELVGDLLGRLGTDLLQALGQTLYIRGDLGLAGRDPLLRRHQVVADDVGDARDHVVHLLEIELASGLVEFIDLGGHSEQLVLGPTNPPSQPL